MCKFLKRHKLSILPFLPVCGCFRHVWLFVTPWTTAHQAPLSMGFSRQEYWSGLPCPPPGDFPGSGTEPGSLMSPASAGRFFTMSATWDAPFSSLPLPNKYFMFNWLYYVSSTKHLKKWHQVPTHSYRKLKWRESF